MLQESIVSKLESSRKELLDLGLRNPLLNYKVPAARGLHIVQEKSEAVFEILVKQGKAMTFTGRPDKTRAAAEDPEAETEEEAAFELPALSGEALESAYTDTKLQTNETESKLQTKLLNTYYAARTSLEEQGVNTLYIALGLLQWYESENSEEIRQAPLLLVPVNLERSNARERFKLKYAATDIEGNLSLQAKLKADFGLQIPALPETDDLDVYGYFEAIEKIIQIMPRWNIGKDNIELGFFSFGKFMLYHDLDSSKWPDDKKPENHPLLAALFETGFRDQQPTADANAFIDKETLAHELFQVVDADSSQILAALAVHEGRNLVIQGPPGTGKSQTITNLIANAIGHGKKVLFVAEKMAALEVVKRRLDSIHLGEACLELHSHKANKKELHEELKRVLELGRPNINQLQHEIQLLQGYLEELNDYCHAINEEIEKSGISSQKVIGHLLRLKEKKGDKNFPKLEITDIAHWDALKMHRAEIFADRIQAYLQENGVPETLPFWGSKLTFLLPPQQESIQQTLQGANNLITGLLNRAEALARHLEFPVPADLAGYERLYQSALLAAEAPDLKGVNIISENWNAKAALLNNLLQTGKELQELKAQYQDIFLPEAWEQEVLEMRQELLAHGEKWYKFIIGSYKKSNKKLAAVCKNPLPKENAAKLKYLDDILESKRKRNLLKENENLLVGLFGSHWQNLESDWGKLNTIAGYLTKVHQQVNSAIEPANLLAYLQKSEPATILKEQAQAFITTLREYKASLKSVLTHLQFDEALRFGSQQPFLQLKATEQAVILQFWLQHLPEIQKTTAWNTLEETSATENLQVLTSIAAHWPEAKDHLKDNLQKTWYEYLLERSVNANPVLRKFERTGHEDVIQKFRKLDRLNLHYNQARAALKHYESVPRLEAGGQVSILKNEFAKRSRHMPIRKLIKEAGLAIQAIKPVFMMSPLSIANFLPPEAMDFDLVVFDEASQVKPVEALGALLRGKQLIVVGDSKQMPPTNFFGSITNNVDEDDEENTTADIQSILEMCEAKGAPKRKLRWHYRSRHESLISLSNHEFYENELVIFPSPGSRQRLGLVFHHLPHTSYDRGKTRANTEEANAVADAVMLHARRNPKLSLGVVAFSTAQMQAIQNALELRRRNHPELEQYFNAHPHEPFFVKNLENVQGDERDAIFISIGYGKTKEGYLAMNFGPLNNEGGERRLNVLVTRAKLRCEVFTNLTADDIDLNRTKAYGIKVLKSFLYFAQHGRLGIAEETGKPADSPFEENVALQLERVGYTVRKQVGSQGFFIDLAIIDPEHPGRYILGIECDGASYHSARSARDRDRLRQQVLEGIGWRIHRIWSTDWFKNPERELERVINAIEQAKIQAHLDDIEPEEQVELPELVREETEAEATEITEYEAATLPAEVGFQELHLHPVGKLAKWLTEVVKIESPVHIDEVVKRFMEAAQVSRAGNRIRQTIQEAAKTAEIQNFITIKQDFLWDYNMTEPTVRNRENLPASSRKMSYIAPEELSLAVEQVVKSAIAIQPDSSIPLVAKRLGFNRVTEDVRNNILQAVNLSLQNGRIQQEGDLLRAQP
ncbi:DUF3320 domain-containing protein [Adhaeribacter soli]|uniref:DUF3320 domain-containing protein n=1 Tax=Adhaeribacter soli TaxID=2607655 RepID=A0A5N1J3T4_9BACT|nr:DUF3320 domain-containing protein [Adhaeribacter soli]KAA9345556.1 DUF3320 domain-containing protein [Adhaeribacter soli]